MTANELRTMYVNFFKERGHKEIASASLLPENDPTVLFTTAGMHPLVPYLLGEKHPGGKRLTDVQKCVRTEDIDEVGDDTHCTFFEMLGNWSLGDYFKQEAISMSFDFLTNYLHIPVEKLAVTVFEGDELAAADVEAEEIWKDFGLKNDQIFRYGSRMWPRGQHLSSRKDFPADFPWRSAPHKPVLRRNGNTVYLTLQSRFRHNK